MKLHEFQKLQAPEISLKELLAREVRIKSGTTDDLNEALKSVRNCRVCARQVLLCDKHYNLADRLRVDADAAFYSALTTLIGKLPR